MCEPDPKRVPALQLILKQLEDRGIPRFLFLNKIDSFDTQVRDILPTLQPASTKPLVLRQIPIWENGAASGFVDLALERAFVYRKQANAEVVEMPSSVKERETEARFHMIWPRNSSDFWSKPAIASSRTKGAASARNCSWLQPRLSLSWRSFAWNCGVFS